MMPPGGGAARGDQLAVLAGLSHSLLVGPGVGEELAEAEAARETDAWRAANLRLMRHAYTRATAMPPDLVEAQARANSACEKVWREARRKSDFAMVRPHLEEVVRLTREAAAALAPALDLSPYDALVDGYQRGMRAADVAPVFADYERFLRGALPQAEERQARNPPPMQPARSVPDREAGGAVPHVCPNVSGSISTTRAWIARRIRSPAARRPTCASPRATTRPTSPRRCSPWCTRPATRCTSAACPRRRHASRWARQPAWRHTKASR